MKYQQDLQVKLQERYRRLYKANIHNCAELIAYFRDWMGTQPELAAIVSTIERSEPEFDPIAWYDEESRHGRNSFKLPPSELQLAKLALSLLDRIQTGDLHAHTVGWVFSNERDGNDALREFMSSVVEQLIEFLQNQLATTSDMLHLLERYARRTKWFEQDRLRTMYRDDTAHGEHNLLDLRRFLFDQGIDYPFTQPASPSGKADVVADLTSDDPLTCEIKLFDNSSYGLAYLAKGVQQAVRYAEDYGKTESQLVIFNLLDRSLELPSDGEPKVWPPRLHVANVTVFLVVVDIGQRSAASKSGPAKPIQVKRTDLLPE